MADGPKESTSQKKQVSKSPTWISLSVEAEGGAHFLGFQCPESLKHRSPPSSLLTMRLLWGSRERDPLQSEWEACYPPGVN